MMEENIRLARQQTEAAASKKPGFSFVSEISGIFSQMSSHDRSLRKREKIREDLVRIYFETEPASIKPDRRNLVTHLEKILRLD